MSDDRPHVRRLPYRRRLEAWEAWRTPESELTVEQRITRAYCPPPWQDLWWEPPPAD